MYNKLQGHPFEMSEKYNVIAIKNYVKKKEREQHLPGC
jgi:hypothetical protein